MKTIFFFIFLFISLVGFSQNPSNYQYRTVRERLLAMMVDSSFHIPRYNGVPSGLRVGSAYHDGALAADTLNGRIYHYWNTVWNRLANYADIAAGSSNVYNTDGYLTTADRYVKGLNDTRGIVFDSMSYFMVTRANVQRLYINSLVSRINSPDESQYFGTENDSSYVIADNNFMRWKTDSTISRKKISYASNIHGTFGPFSLIDKSYADSIVAAAGGTPTLQQVLTAGSILTTDNSVTLGTNAFKFIRSSGLERFIINPNDGIYMIGDNSDSYLSLDTSNHLVALQAKSGSYLQLDGDNNILNVVLNGGFSALNLDGANGIYKLGDNSGFGPGNGTHIDIRDGDETIRFLEGSRSGASNGYVWTLINQTTGEGGWAAGGGGSNFANADLTQTANRIYDGGGFTYTLNNLGTWTKNWGNTQSSWSEGFVLLSGGTAGGSGSPSITFSSDNTDFSELDLITNGIGYNSQVELGEATTGVNIQAVNKNIGTGVLSRIKTVGDSILFQPYLGRMNIDSLQSTVDSTYKPMVWNKFTKQWKVFNSWNEIGLGGEAVTVNTEDWYSFKDEFPQNQSGNFEWNAAFSASVAALTTDIPDGWMFGGRFSTAASSTGLARTWVSPSAAGVHAGIAIVSGKRFNVGWKIQLTDLSDGTDTYKIFAGFADNSQLSNVTDGVYFTYTHSASSGQFVCNTESNNSITSTASGVTVAADTDYELEISVYNGSAYFYINKTLVHTETLTIPTGNARATGVGASIEKSAGTNARDMLIDWGAYGVRAN